MFFKVFTLNPTLDQWVSDSIHLLVFSCIPINFHVTIMYMYLHVSQDLHVFCQMFCISTMFRKRFSKNFTTESSTMPYYYYLHLDHTICSTLTNCTNLIEYCSKIMHVQCFMLEQHKISKPDSIHVQFTVSPKFQLSVVFQN